MADPGAPSGARTDRYGGVARFFHWSIAALIVLQYVLAELGERAEDGGERLRALALLANHKSVGMTVLALAILRVAWRFLRTPPAFPLAMPNWQRTASFVSHWSLYALIFALPLTGWLLSSAAAYSVSWFGLFTWPDLVEPSKAIRGAMHEAHEVLGKLLFVVAVVHILAALKHHFFDHDNVLRRMSSAASYGLFAALIVAGVLTLTRVGGTADRAPADSAAAEAETPAPAAPSSEPAASASGVAAAVETGSVEPPAEPEAAPPEAIAEAVPEAEETPTAEPAPAGTPPAPAPAPPPAWRIDHGASFIEFTAEQAGAPFTGRWTDWSADMRFSPDALSDSAFDVVIRVAGVETEDDDRDATLQDPEFFNAARFPEARFLTGPVRANGEGYVSEGTLTIKGTAHPVTFRFQVEADGATRRLTGSARLDRLALGVGTGEWADTEWIGQYVDVSVRVAAEVAPD